MVPPVADDYDVVPDNNRDNEPGESAEELKDVVDVLVNGEAADN